jgi:hypothetical protein
MIITFLLHAKPDNLVEILTLLNFSLEFTNDVSPLP